VVLALERMGDRDPVELRQPLVEQRHVRAVLADRGERCASVTSLRDDLTTSLEQYARALIPAYWVIDVPGRRILVHTEPRVVAGQGEYARVATYRPGQSLPLVLDGQEVARIPFDELLR